MSKTQLTEDAISDIEEMSNEDLNKMIVTNERKKRRIAKDQKDYTKACRELQGELEAKTAFALETLENREVAAGLLPPPSPVPVVAFPEKRPSVKVPLRPKLKAAS